MALTAFEEKKEEIKSDARTNKYSVWYQSTVTKPEIQDSDQINGKLFTGVENGIKEYYDERNILNGKTTNTFLGDWDNITGNSPWRLSVVASDFSTFPLLSQKYTDLNVYKPSPYVYKNGESGSGNGGLKNEIDELEDISDQLLNGYVFDGAGNGPGRYSSSIDIRMRPDPDGPPLTYDGLYITLPGGGFLPSGRYYIEAAGVEWLGDLVPATSYNPVTQQRTFLGYYNYTVVHSEPSGFESSWATQQTGTIYNYYEWTNSQRTSGGDWWTDTWNQFPQALSEYYNTITSTVSKIDDLEAQLEDIIDYYKDDTVLIGTETETNWAILGGTGTWDNPTIIAIGWSETNSFYDEVTTGSGSGSWQSQLNAHLPASPTSPGSGYSDSEINAVNTIASDFDTKIDSRVYSLENDILGTLTPETADGSFSQLRAIRYLWVDARLNKSGGTLVNLFSTNSGISILTDKAELLNEQLDALRIPDDEKEPRIPEVDCSRMEYVDQILISWTIVLQATQYEIYRFDAGTGDAGRLYNATDGPDDSLFTLIDTVDALDDEDLPVIRYTDDDPSLQVGHFYFYKMKVLHDGTGFPPPYDSNGDATSPESPTESLLSLNFYDDEVWRYSDGTTAPGFLNSGALQG